VALRRPSRSVRACRQIGNADIAIDRQLDAIEQGVDAQLVGKRITKLKDERATAEAALRDLPDDSPAGDGDLAATLDRLPDLSAQLHSASPEALRALFESFCLRVTFDKQRDTLQLSAAITERLAEALGGAAALPTDAVASNGIAGAGFEPATFGL
jgi:hypothetical protein